MNCYNLSQSNKISRGVGIGMRRLIPRHRVLAFDTNILSQFSALCRDTYYEDLLSTRYAVAHYLLVTEHALDQIFLLTSNRLTESLPNPMSKDAIPTLLILAAPQHTFSSHAPK